MAVQRGGGETCRARSGSPLEAMGTVCPGRVAGAGPVAGPLRPHSALFWDIDSTLSQGDEDEPVRVLIFLDGALATFSFKLPGRERGISPPGALPVDAQKGDDALSTSCSGNSRAPRHLHRV